MTKFFNLFLIVLSILSYTPLSQAIDHRKEINTAQDWANTFNRPYPIHIFNRDELHFLFLQNKVTLKNKDDEQKRQTLIGEYIFEKLGIQLDKTALSNIESQLFLTPGSAVALPILKNYNSKEYQMCGVFVNSPNGNDRIEVERISGMNNKDVYSKDESYNNLSIKEDFEVMYLFSMYHEVSHCLDQTYMNDIYDSYQPSAHDVHESESFAETLAYLQLTKRFGNDIAKSRILYRILYSRKIGEFFAKNPSLSFGDQLVMSGGGIYFLSPVLVEAYTLVSQRKIKPNELSNDELYDKAATIVKERALPFRSFSSIVRSLTEGAEPVIDQYEKMAFDSPEFFLNAYERLVSYHALTDAWLKRGFSENTNPSAPLLDEADLLPTETLCELISANDMDTFLDTLDDYRDLLNTSSFSNASRYQRYTELNKLSQTLSGKCGVTTLLTDNTVN